MKVSVTSILLHHASVSTLSSHDVCNGSTMGRRQATHYSVTSGDIMPFSKRRLAFILGVLWLTPCKYSSEILFVATGTYSKTRRALNELNLNANRATAVCAITSFLPICSQFAIVGIWLRIAISLTDLLSSTRRPVLVECLR